MKVRIAKKKLKAEKDPVYPDRPYFEWIKWDHKAQSFLVDTYWGQRMRVLF